MSEHLGYDKPEKTESVVGQQIHRITRKLVKRANKMADDPKPNVTRYMNSLDVGDKTILSSTPLDAPMKSIAVKGRNYDGSKGYHQVTSELGGTGTFTLSEDKMTAHTGSFSYLETEEVQNLPATPIHENIHGSAKTLATIHNAVAEAEVQNKNSKAA